MIGLVLAMVAAVAIMIYSETCAEFIRDKEYGRKVFLIIFCLLCAAVMW